MVDVHTPPMAERRKLFLGLDLGQASDAACLGGMLRVTSPGPVDPATFARSELVRFDFSSLERFPTGTTYPDVVRRCATVLEGLTERWPDRDIELLVDKTGVGAGVVDILRELKIWRAFRGADRGSVTLVPVTLTSGDNVNVKPAGFCVPKSDVVASAVVLFQSGLLRISESIADRELLIRELVNFRQFVNKKGGGSLSFSNDGKIAKHDDTVTVLTFCAWGAQRDRRPGGYLQGLQPLPNSW